MSSGKCGLRSHRLWPRTAVGGHGGAAAEGRSGEAPVLAEGQQAAAAHPVVGLGAAAGLAAGWPLWHPPLPFPEVPASSPTCLAPGFLDSGGHSKLCTGLPSPDLSLEAATQQGQALLTELSSRRLWFSLRWAPSLPLREGLARRPSCTLLPFRLPVRFFDGRLVELQGQPTSKASRCFQQAPPPPQ